MTPIGNPKALGLRSTRRAWFQSVAGGVYGAALAELLGADLLRAASPSGMAGAGAGEGDRLAPRSTHFPPRARSVIQLFMNGGPSQMDLLDPKPELTRRHGQSYFNKIAGEVENIASAGAILRSPFQFRQHGESGLWVSELYPHLARCADELAVLRGMYTTNLTHEPALNIIQSGQMRTGYPVMGSWIVYGLGSENRNLPAYVVLDDPEGLPVNGIENWTAGFLPPVCQGTRFRSQGVPVLNLRPNPADPPRVAQAAQDFLARFDRRHLAARPHQSALEARISSYELAGRMQLAAGDALDVTGEDAATRELYGIGQAATDSYGRRCLIARRLVERGVRFVQIFINGQIWDHHTAIEAGLKTACRKTDQPIAALLTDLKRRGLLDSTLVVWGGDFGRLPIAQLSEDRNEQNAGRDHNKNAFTTWMAGGGVRRGIVHGATDELGMTAVEGRVSVPDWHATILHLLGLNHEELFLERNGLQEKLTGVNPAQIVREILA